MRPSKSQRAQEAEATAQSLVGATISGKYRVQRVLGAGAMGIVCEAQHVTIGKRVAVKLLGNDVAKSYDSALRFRREARAANAVESDHVVQIFDIEEDDDYGLYMVMELLRGEDLAARLERDGRFDLDASVRIARQIALGLSKLHGAGVVHRDLKPANVFLARDEHGADRVKLLDFGISKLLEGAPQGRSDVMLRTRRGVVIGTPQYMSPEQAQGLPTVDQRTDIWSLGLVLYEMLSGARAYPATDTYEQFIVQLVTQPARPLREVAPWVPESIAGVVHHALQHDPSARLANGRDFLEALDRAYTEAGPSPAPVEDGDGGSTIVMDSTEFPLSSDDEDDDGDGKTPTRGTLASSPDASGPSPRSVLESSAVREKPEVDDEPAQIFSRHSLRNQVAAPAAAPAHGAAITPPTTSPAAEPRRSRADVVIAAPSARYVTDTAALEVDPTQVASKMPPPLATTARRERPFPVPLWAIAAVSIAIIVGVIVAVLAALLG